MTDKKSMKSNAQREFGDFVKRDLVGADEWRSSKIGYLTGVSSIVRGGATALRGTGNGAKLIGSMFKGLFTREKVQPLPTDSTDPVERFRVAQQAYGRSDEEVAQMVSRSGRQAWVYAVLSISLLVWAFYRIGDGNNGPYGPIFPLLPLLFVVPLLIRTAFWNWQLRTRRLGSPHEFMKSPGEWLPALRSLPTKVVAIFGLGLLAMSLLVPEIALAAPDDGLPEFLSNASNASADVFLRSLGVIAGGVGPVPQLFGGENSPWVVPLGNAFAAFNGALLAIAGAMLGWHTLSGMVSTAHEGKVLGQRWHQIWAPVRVMVGVGTLVPVVGGFAAVQILVLQIAVWGSALGNVVWHAYIDTWKTTAYVSGVGTDLNMADYKAALYKISTDDEVVNLIFPMFQQSVCLAGMADAAKINAASYAARYGDDTASIMQSLSGEATSAAMLEAILPNNLERSGMVYTDPLGSAGNDLSLMEVLNHTVSGELGLFVNGTWRKVPPSQWASLDKGEFSNIDPAISWNFGDICGSTTIMLDDLNEVTDFLEARDSADNKAAAYAAMAASGDRLASGIDQHVMQPIAAAARQFAETVRHPEKLDDAEAARKLLFSRDGQITLALASAYANYEQILGDERRQIADGIYSLADRDSFTAMIDRAKEMGWSSSGAYYMMVGKMVEHDLNMGTIKASPTPPSTDALKNERTDISDIFYHPYTGLMNALDAYEETSWTAVTRHASNEALIQDFEWKGLDLSWWDIVQGYINKFVREGLEPILHKFEPDPFNAMVHMVAFGKAIMGVATILFIAMATTWGGAVAAKFAGAAWGKIPVFGGLFKGLGEMASDIGLMLASAIKMAFFVILAIGLVHAYLIPMLPYVYMLFFVTGMLILVGEGLIAAPIWAFMHIRMDGQDFVDQVQKPGYMIAFNLLLRPALAVFGLILSMVIFSASIFFMNETYRVATHFAVPDTEGVALIGMLSALVIQVYLHYQIAIRSFQLIVQVPDRVTRWFGQNSENLGEDGDSKHVVAALVSNSEGRLDKTAGIMAAGKKARADVDPEKDPKGKGGDANPEGDTKPDGGGQGDSDKKAEGAARSDPPIR